jgi:hypothetical protein
MAHLYAHIEQATNKAAGERGMKMIMEMVLVGDGDFDINALDPETLRDTILAMPPPPEAQRTVRTQPPYPHSL